MLLILLKQEVIFWQWKVV